MRALAPYEIRPFDLSDRAWARRLLTERWDSPRIVTRGRVHQADQLPGWVAAAADGLIGLLTYQIAGRRCEIVSLDSLVERQGVGTALLAAAQRTAHEMACTRLWLITTNDNLAAVRFYQRRGFVLAALHRDALELSRRLKPEIPLVGIDGIPLRDEIELEMPL
jgi:ribosomal protein S18 acetylase RimI-like enzyme